VKPPKKTRSPRPPASPSVWDRGRPAAFTKPIKGAPKPAPAKRARTSNAPAAKSDAVASPEPARRELKYYGIAACLALWEQRPHDIIRIYLEEALIPKFTPLLRWASGKRKAYHLVESEDLERLTDSIHHQGICILARERSPLEFSDLLGLLREDQGRQLLVYLDGVENPYNLGAIVRSCAHFGVRFILGAEGRLPRLSGAACRVAEGGAEQIGMVLLRHPTRQLRQLQELGFQLLATAGGRGESLYRHDFAPRSLLVMGAEQHGISASVFDLAQQAIKIPGSGQVESLNVSVAFALCAGEYYRQQLAKGRR